eukprot:1160037-Pelagomonas_calceolata.AAC.8
MSKRESKRAGYKTSKSGSANQVCLAACQVYFDANQLALQQLDWGYITTHTCAHMSVRTQFTFHSYVALQKPCVLKLRLSTQ